MKNGPRHRQKESESWSVTKETHREGGRVRRAEGERGQG